jgi:RNA polymerase sigma-70 factor (ECF subfamily)
MGPLLTGDEQRALAQGIREGDPSAEETFVRLFGDRVRIMLMVRLRDVETARELTQDAMLASWRGIRDGQLRDPERLAAFVHGTARNVLNNYIRAHAGTPRLEPLNEASDAHAGLAPVDDDRRTMVAAALADLSAEDRQVLTMTLVRGLRPREIAQSLGLSVDVVRTRKSRAIKRISEVIVRLSRMPAKAHYPN